MTYPPTIFLRPTILLFLIRSWGCTCKSRLAVSWTSLGPYVPKYGTIFRVPKIDLGALRKGMRLVRPVKARSWRLHCMPGWYGVNAAEGPMFKCSDTTIWNSRAPWGMSPDGYMIWPNLDPDLISPYLPTFQISHVIWRAKWTSRYRT